MDIDWFLEDPLPTAPYAHGSMRWWRWYSDWSLRRRAAMEPTESTQWTGDDTRDELGQHLDFCVPCEAWPCLCAAIESGEVCGRCHHENEPGPRAGLWHQCGACFGGRD